MNHVGVRTSKRGFPRRTSGFRFTQRSGSPLTLHFLDLLHVDPELLLQLPLILLQLLHQLLQVLHRERTQTDSTTVENSFGPTLNKHPGSRLTRGLATGRMVPNHLRDAVRKSIQSTN